MYRSKGTRQEAAGGRDGARLWFNNSVGTYGWYEVRQVIVSGSSCASWSSETLLCISARCFYKWVPHAAQERSDVFHENAHKHTRTRRRRHGRSYWSAAWHGAVWCFASPSLTWTRFIYRKSVDIRLQYVSNVSNWSMLTQRHRQRLWDCKLIQRKRLHQISSTVRRASRWDHA